MLDVALKKARVENGITTLSASKDSNISHIKTYFPCCYSFFFLGGKNMENKYGGN